MLEETKMMKTTGLNRLKVIIIGTLVFYAIRAPFEHKKYEYVNNEFSPEYLAHKAKYKYKGWNAYYYFKLIIGPHQATFVLALLLYVIFNPNYFKNETIFANRPILVSFFINY